MFPSEAYRELCIENQEVLREEWEPKVADIVLLNVATYPAKKANWHVGTLCQILSLAGFEIRDWTPCKHWGGHRYASANAVIPLFQPRQLIEMLEERGYEHGLMWEMYGPRPDSETRYRVEIRSRLGWEKIEGPDPATALLKAYLEVVKEGAR